MSLVRDQFDDYQVTRFLLAAEATGVPVTLVINKSDLLEEHECDQLLSRVSGWGYKPIALSVDEGTGIKEISRRLMKRWSVVVGPSGIQLKVVFFSHLLVITKLLVGCMVMNEHVHLFHDNCLCVQLKVLENPRSLII